MRQELRFLANIFGFATVAASLIFMGNTFAAEIFGYMGQVCTGFVGSTPTDCTNVASYIEPNIYIKSLELVCVLLAGVFLIFKVRHWFRK